MQNMPRKTNSSCIILSSLRFNKVLHSLISLRFNKALHLLIKCAKGAAQAKHSICNREEVLYTEIFPSSGDVGNYDFT